MCSTVFSQFRLACSNIHTLQKSPHSVTTSHIQADVTDQQREMHNFYLSKKCIKRLKLMAAITSVMNTYRIMSVIRKKNSSLLMTLSWIHTAHLEPGKFLSTSSIHPSITPNVLLSPRKGPHPSEGVRLRIG